MCARCDNELFSSAAKYKHSSPWPAFTETIHAESLTKRPESPGALKVTETSIAVVYRNASLLAIRDVSPASDLHFFDKLSGSTQVKYDQKLESHSLV